jgi:hypothetical protein
MIFGEWAICILDGHEWVWLTRRTQECKYCKVTRVLK